MKKENLKQLLEKINISVAKLYHLATHDEKTGLYNNVFFKDVFDLEINQAKRGANLSLIIIDIDFFKKINDTFGHLQADKILFMLAKLFQKHIRKYDIVSRFGGEEFFIMLPNTEIKRAHQIAERLRKSVITDNYLKKYKVTISAGVSSYKTGDNLEKISKRADNALYKAKKSGRNCVKIA